jgi:diguanylate cyclase (GGDEF)-like protein
MAALDREMERTRRTGLVTSLIMMDLDHFKVFNDTYGHQFGDAVLHRVGLLLMETIRKLDIPCRYGGEEFALILPGTRLPQGVRLAERLRVSLPQVWMAPQDRPEGITASFGVDVYSGKEELTPEAFLQRADRWLLLAKARGRNTVCHPDQSDASREAGLSRRERTAFFLPEDPAAGARGSHG